MSLQVLQHYPCRAQPGEVNNPGEPMDEAYQRATVNKTQSAAHGQIR